jgi:hypothetical protein
MCIPWWLFLGTSSGMSLEVPKPAAPDRLVELDPFSPELS